MILINDENKANEKLGRKINVNFSKNKKLFWKEMQE